MRRSIRQALGVDLSQTQVQMALLRRERRGLRLVKAVRAPLPDGAIRDGHIEDPAAVAKVVHGLRVAHKLRHEQAAVALDGMPAFIQILQLPKNMPTNVGQFVQNEIKQFIALSGERILSDYCGMGSRAKGDNLLFVVAADGKRVSDLVSVCRQARIYADVVEPSLLGLVRSVYAKRVAKRFDRNVLLAVLRDQWLKLTVFRSGQMDFVRVRSVGDLLGRPGDLEQHVASELATLIQYYEIEVLQSPEKWEITLMVDDPKALPADVSDRLRARFPTSALEILSSDTVAQAVSLGPEATPASTEPVSPVAAGLAMRLLMDEDWTPKVNLLPPETKQLLKVKKHALISAVAAACLLCIMALSVIGLQLQTEHKRDQLTAKHPAGGMDDTMALVEHRRALESDIEKMNQGKGYLVDILKTEAQIDWAGLLADIRQATPQNVCITRLSNRDGSTLELYIDGVSSTYQAVSIFSGKLSQSPRMASAQRVKTEQGQDGPVAYQIRCVLRANKGL